MSEKFFDDETYRKIFGIQNVNDIQFSESIIETLAGIDRALLPKPAEHPLSAEISEGERSIQKLLDMLTVDDVQKSLDAIDALAHIFLYAKTTKQQRAQLGEAVAHFRSNKSDDPRIAMGLKTLAIAQDESLMLSQLERLSDEDPGVVASAARLLGFGRFALAEPALRGLVSPERLFESRAVIWALGEIGSRASLPALEYALSSGFRTVDCMIAMGKIGAIESVPKLLPMMIGGLPKQVDAAYRALSMLLNTNRDLAKNAAFRSSLVPLLLNDLGDDAKPKSGSIRFHMCLCLARMGETLNASTVRRFLGISISDEAASDMARFFIRG